MRFFTRWTRRQTQATPKALTTEKVRSRQQRFRSPWLRWGWAWLTTVELLWHYAWHVALPLLCGQVVICDRYLYDTLADWAAYFNEPAVEKRWAAKALRLFSPRPHVAYWLDVPPELAKDRSTDQSPNDFLLTQRAAYQRLTSLYGLHRVEGLYRTWQEISDDIVYEVLSTYFARYHTFINCLFLKNPGQWK
ncbi:MAG: hypothetical protein H5T63_00465 [Chloroflexi bacterium]|nr:hypothetical protein [Chloroflexota bacterium]